MTTAMAAVPLDPTKNSPLTHRIALIKDENARLSLLFESRMALGVGLAALSGLMLGLAHGSNEAGYRFRAENAHRLPQTQTGWYLYHKSKNYHRMLGGIKEGAYMAGRLGIWTVLFVGMEEAIDGARVGLARLRGGESAVERVSRDFLSTGLAGVGTAGAFSLWNRFPISTTARVAKLGLKAGIAYGLLQDVASALRGRRIGYIGFVKQHIFGTTRDAPDTDRSAVG